MSQEFSAPICAGDGEAQRYVGREGAYETHVRAHRAQSSSTPLCQRLNVIMTRWRGLIQIARNPYRPELHYMRGPGPKWYAKHPKTARFDFADLDAEECLRDTTFDSARPGLSVSILDEKDGLNLDPRCSPSIMMYHSSVVCPSSALSGLQLTLQAAVRGGCTLDAFTLGEDCLGRAEVDVGQVEIVELS